MPSVPDLDQVRSDRELDHAIETMGTDPKACLICEHSEFSRIFKKQGKWFWRCQNCELVFVHDIYPEFARDTDELTYDDLAAERTEPKPRQRREYGALLDDFETVRSTGKFLEVGCGPGLFLGSAVQRGWDCVGIEMLDSMADVTRERYGVRVEPDLFAAEFEAESFDVCYMNEVIEHVVNPVPMMQEIHRVLRPGGVALLRTGNARSWSARLNGAKWWYYHFGGHGHIRFFGPESAEALCRAGGFERVEVGTRGFAFIDGIDLRGHWYRPVVRITQSLVSPFAGPFGAGHRLTMRFVKSLRQGRVG